MSVHSNGPGPLSVAEVSDPLPVLDADIHPVINTPGEELRRHWELDAHGRAADGRPHLSAAAPLDSQRVASRDASV